MIHGEHADKYLNSQILLSQQSNGILGFLNVRLLKLLGNIDRRR
jgi:hypothetical protein